MQTLAVWSRKFCAYQALFSCFKAASFSLVSSYITFKLKLLEYLSGFNYLICYQAGQLGTKPDALTYCKDVYPCGENAHALANLHNSQSMFKAGQLLQAIILNSASLLISI